MKKVFFMFFVLSILFTGCKRGDDVSSRMSDRGNVKIGLATDRVGIGDSSFVGMHYTGLLAAQEIYGKIDIIIMRTEDGTPEEFTRVVGLLASEEKCDMIISAGSFQSVDAINELAKAYPKIKFVITDVVADKRDNVASLLFDQYQGSFLAGAFAAKMTKTKKLACIGGVDTDVINEFINGFHNGVKYVDDTIDFHYEYLTLQPDYSGYALPDKGYEAAKAMYEEGVDIIYAAAGFSSTGAIKCAREMEEFVIAVDSDLDFMARGFVLTSMLKRVDIAVFDITEKFLNDNFGKGGVFLYSLNNGGISLTDMKYTKDKIPESVLTYIEDLEDRIVSGNFFIN